MNRTIAFIGAVGVPNNYGGFEMFLESCAPPLARDFCNVLITCDSSRYSDKTRLWQGVRRVFIPIAANGGSSILHDLLAFLAVFWRAQAIIVLGVSGGIFFPLFRLLCALTGKKLIVNVDGVEWRRGKFSRLKRWFLFVSDRLAQKCSHEVIVDNDALRPFLTGTVSTSAVLIAYPGDHVLRKNTGSAKTEGGQKCLTICRIEPENNCHLLLEAFVRAGAGQYTFVGNWNASEYGRNLRERYKAVPGLEMRDPVYNKDVLCELREGCTLYLHGHSVGGTNPSLVEMLFYDCEILAFDCSFNRSTADRAIGYFSNEQDLAERIRTGERSHSFDRMVVRSKYTRKKICSEYAALVNKALGAPHVPSLLPPTDLEEEYELSIEKKAGD